MSKFFTLFAACLLGIVIPSAAGELTVQRVLWGFDGQVVPGTFNPLSVLVANPGTTAFDGQLELRPGPGPGAREGGVLAAPCQLAPGASRWVQFYPYFHNDYGPGSRRWTVTWGPEAGERSDLDAPAFDAPARVWFTKPGDGDESLPSFPEELFPPTVAATDGLDTAVLDHAPHWEPAQRAAFLDWVWRGGTVHLLPDLAGREPEFAGELAPLNAPPEGGRVGHGRVIRHHGPRGPLLQDNAFLTVGPPAPTLAKGTAPTIYDLENSVFRMMNQTTRPRVRWGLLCILTAVYLLAVGPGHYLWARQPRDYRISLAVLAAGVTGCALLFGYLGRRGFNERSKVLTVATARALDGNRYDVMAWSNVFVTSGGVYTLKDGGDRGLYSVGTAGSGTAGVAASGGGGGGYRVDLPLYSSCALLHRAVLTGEDTRVTPTAWKTDGAKLTELRLRLPTGFDAARLRNAWVRYGGRFYSMVPSDGTLELSGSGHPESGFLMGTELNQGVVAYEHSEDPSRATEGVFVNCQRALIANSLGGGNQMPRNIVRAAPPETQVELFLFVDGTPRGLHLRGVEDATETSAVMYRRTLEKP